MDELLREIFNAEIEQDSDVDFYKGVVYALRKMKKITANEQNKLYQELEVKLLQI